MSDCYEFILEVAGHKAIDKSRKDVDLVVYVKRNTTHKVVVPVEQVAYIAETRGLPMRRALEEAFLCSVPHSVMLTDVKTVGCNKPEGAVIADMLGCGTNTKTKLERGDVLDFTKPEILVLSEQPKGSADGQSHNPVHIEVRDALGRLKQKQEGKNLRTDSGDDWQSDAMGTLGTQPGPGKYIGVTANAVAPAQTDTTLTGEIASGTLIRAIYTAYNHTAGVASYNQTKTFTSDQTVTLAKAAEFIAAAGGNGNFHTLITPNAPTVSGDTVAFTWTKNI